jgi:multicomponent Na+:H+ antiporter subunit C
MEIELKRIIINFPFIACVLLVILGIYGILFKRNFIKMAISVTLIQSGVNLFLITLSYRKDSIAPIFTHVIDESKAMTLPTPQALTLTSIVIGLATTALMLSFCILIYQRHKTLSADKLKEIGK